LANFLLDVRCDMRDAMLAVETGVDGLDVVIGTSSFLREHSHGKSMAYIEKTAIEVIEYIKSKGLEVRCKLTKFSYNESQHAKHFQPYPPSRSSRVHTLTENSLERGFLPFRSC
jgi:isopropylmalate/homocitrate/citramalate synthase